MARFLGIGLTDIGRDEVNMADTNWNQIFGDLFKASQNSYKAKDDQRMDIAIQKSKYEENLDEMWRIYNSGTVQQIVEYQKQIDSIKNSGCRVLRNSDGKHKIVIE